MGESDRPLTILSEENRLCGARPEHLSVGSSRQHAELVAVGLPRQQSEEEEEECTITAAVSVAALPSLTPHHCRDREHHCSEASRASQMEDVLSPSASEQSLGSEMSATADEHTSFSKEIITFSLFGRIHPKCSKFAWSTMQLKIYALSQ